MAIRRIRIGYTLYSPDYKRESGLCLDFATFGSAKRRARGLGRGSNIVRNFNQRSKDGSTDWWQDHRYWFFSGVTFRKVLPDLSANKWHMDDLHSFRQAELLSRRLT